VIYPMAFWASAGNATSAAGLRPAAAPAKPLAVLLHCPGDFTTLVRLKIRLLSSQQTAADEDDDEAVVQASATSLARLHRLLIGIETRSADAAKLTITEVLQPPDTLQLLCQKVSQTGLLVHTVVLHIMRASGVCRGSWDLQLLWRCVSQHWFWHLVDIQHSCACKQQTALQLHLHAHTLQERTCRDGHCCVLSFVTIIERYSCAHLLT
jgi:hypothetical protein